MSNNVIDDGDYHSVTPLNEDEAQQVPKGRVFQQSSANYFALGYFPRFMFTPTTTP